MKQIYILLLASFALFSSGLHAELFKVNGKVDIAAAIIDVDILQSGKTTETLHMWGSKGEATLVAFGGWFLKPGYIAAGGDGTLYSFSIGVGHFYPYKDFIFMPSVGVTFTHLKNKVDLEQIQQFDLTQKFHSTSPYVGIEVCYKLTSKWTLMGLYQYAWSKTHTTIKPFVSDKSHSDGPNYGLGVDYSLTPNWSITFGVGYNITLSHEKHGLRGKGAKLGIAYYF